MVVATLNDNSRSLLLPIILNVSGSTIHMIRIVYNNKPDILWAILLTLKEGKISVLSGLMSSLPNSEVGQLVLCIDLAGSNVSDLDELINKINSIEGVELVEACQTEYPNLIVNTLIKPMITVGERAIINHAKGLALALEYLYRRFPVGEKP